jgi:hypothetical protein
VLLALLLAAVLAVGVVALAADLMTPESRDEQLVDGLAGVTIPLPEGWSEGTVPPVTGFTSVVRRGESALVMARRVTGVTASPKKAAADAADLYSRLLLKGDRVALVDDRAVPGGHTRAFRAEYRDVVNRPAHLRVTLLTRSERHILLVGLAQPADNASTSAVDAVLASVR